MQFLVDFAQCTTNGTSYFDSDYTVTARVIFIRVMPWYYQSHRVKKINAEFLKELLNLSLWFVQALWLPATLALLCSNRRYADGRPLHDFTNFVLNHCGFFIGGENGITPRKPSRRDQKAAKNGFRCDCRSHSLALGLDWTGDHRVEYIDAEWSILTAITLPIELKHVSVNFHLQC